MEGKRGKALLYNLIGITNWNRIKLLLHSLRDKRQGNTELLKRNQIFKNKYHNQRCFIIGNGPSAGRINTDLLQNEIIFTVNQYPKADNYEALHPAFHFWADEQFFDLHEDNPGDMATLNTMRMAKTEVCCPGVFYKLTAKDLIKKYNLDKELDLFYFSAGQTFNPDSKKPFDLSKYLPWFPTVVQYCIAAAVYMGFNRIYLLGCECTGFMNMEKVKNSANNGKYEYAFQMNSAEQERFVKRVAQRTSAEEMWLHYKVLDYYEKLKKYCDQKEIQLVNCTEGGILDSLPRMSLEEVIKG